MKSSNGGFTLIEVMVATVVLVVGLCGAAALQTNSFQGIFRADAQASGSAMALAWSEWLSALVSHADQDKIPYFDSGSLCKENFVHLASIDNNPNDEQPIQVQLPSSAQELADCFNGLKSFSTSRGQITLKFRKPGDDALIPAEMPPAASHGARLLLRIYADVPAPNTATVEFFVVYNNAFLSNQNAKNPTLRIVIGSNL